MWLSTQRLRPGCWPRSRGYRLMASSLSTRPSQQSCSETDCDQEGEWPKYISQGEPPLRATLKSSAMSDGSSPAPSYCIVGPVEVKWKALNHDVLSLD